MNNKTIIVTVSPAVECWGNFRKLCKARGWKYQTLSNRRKVPKPGKPVKIEGEAVHKVPLL